MRFGGQPSGLGALAGHDRDGLAGDRLAGDGPIAHAREESAGIRSAVAEPGVECCDGVRDGVLAVDHGHDLTVGVLVLDRRMVSRMPPGWNSTSARVSAASSERRIAEAKPSRMIAASRAPTAVDVRDDLADLAGAQRSGLAPGSGADDPAQTSADLPNPFGEDRVPQALHPVAVRDGAAGEVDGADREAVGRPFSEVRADQRRLRGQRRGAAGGAPALPLAPREVLHGAGRLGVRGGDRLTDPDGLVDGEAGERVGRSGGRCQGWIHPEVVRSENSIFVAGFTAAAAPSSWPLPWPSLTRAVEEGAAHPRSAMALAVVSMKGALNGHRAESRLPAPTTAPPVE